MTPVEASYLGAYDAEATIDAAYKASYDAGATIDGGYTGILGASGDSPLTLGDPVGDYTGRVGRAVPANAARLPFPTGGVAPVTYTVADLPAGVTQTNGVLAGNPTTARHGAAAEVTITATDSADTPVTITKTFDFSILASSNVMTLEDLGFRGYHALELTGIVYAFAGTFGTSIPVFTSNNRIVWARPPRGTVGTLHTDAEQDFDLNGNNLWLNRVRYDVHTTNHDNFILNHSNTNMAGNTLSPSFHLFNWATTGAGVGKAAYFGFVDGTFAKFVFGQPTSGRGTFAGGDVWCRWTAIPSEQATIFRGKPSGTGFGMMIADA